jgi:preprotein translocase subunit SecY
MIEAIRNAFTLPDLRRKIVFTLLILVAYRAAAHVPVPGVDTQALQSFLESGEGGQYYCSIPEFVVRAERWPTSRLWRWGFTLILPPRLLCSFLTPLVPQLQELSKEGEQGRNKINLYTHWLTVPLGFFAGLWTGNLYSKFCTGHSDRFWVCVSIR